MHWSFLNQKILLINGNPVCFDNNIKSIAKIDDLLIVLTWNILMRNIDKQPVNNIYGINKNGDIEWIIKEILKIDDIYSNIFIDEFNNLVVVNILGVHYVIDVIEKTFKKGNL